MHDKFTCQNFDYQIAAVMVMIVFSKLDLQLPICHQCPSPLMS